MVKLLEDLALNERKEVIKSLNLRTSQGKNCNLRDAKALRPYSLQFNCETGCYSSGCDSCDSCVGCDCYGCYSSGN